MRTALHHTLSLLADQSRDSIHSNSYRGQCLGLEISGRQSYFATINFVLTTITLNVVIHLTPGFSTFRWHWHLTACFKWLQRSCKVTLIWKTTLSKGQKWHRTLEPVKQLHIVMSYRSSDFRYGMQNEKRTNASNTGHCFFSIFDRQPYGNFFPPRIEILLH